MIKVLSSQFYSSIPSTKVVENPFQVQMPATIEELQGVAAGLREVVIGLVNTIQQCALLQAHTTASTSHANSADTTSGSNNQHLSTLQLPTLQLPTFRQHKTAQDDTAEF